MTRRVVVTGIGAVTPHGDLAQTIEAIDAGRSALAAVRAFDATPFVESRGGECRTFDARPWFRQAKTLKLADRRTRLAVAAAGMAVAQAGLTTTEEAGVVIGTSGSDLQTEDCGRAVGSPAEGDVLDVDYFGGRILRKLNPLWLLVNLANMASAHVAIQLDAHGPNSTITTDWIAGLQAIGEASRWIAEGEVDVVIAGGADCGVLPFVYASLEQARILGNGFVPGEGAALFVLESLEHARGRGARAFGELVGYASSAAANAVEITTRRALADCSRDDYFSPVADHRSLVGHALAADAPIALAVALGRAVPRRLLINAVGSMGQSASLAVVACPELGSLDEEGERRPA